MTEAALKVRGVDKLWTAYNQARRAFGEDLGNLLASRFEGRAWTGIRVLDDGCGSGSIGEALAHMGADVTALEPALGTVSKIAGREAASPTGRLRVLSADAQALPFGDAEFDVVILSDVIEHVRDPERVVREVGRVLRPGGLAYISMPNRFSIVNLISDPHYNVPGVGLMPFSVAEWYVVKLLRITDGYRTYQYFSFRGVTRLITRAGMNWQELRGRYEKKIRSGEMSFVPSRRWMLKLAYLPGVRSLLLRFLYTRFFKYAIQPGWEFLAFKDGAPSTYCN